MQHFEGMLLELRTKYLSGVNRIELILWPSLTGRLDKSDGSYSPHRGLKTSSSIRFRSTPIEGIGSKSKGSQPREGPGVDILGSSSKVTPSNPVVSSTSPTSPKSPKSPKSSSASTAEGRAESSGVEKSSKSSSVLCVCVDCAGEMSRGMVSNGGLIACGVVSLVPQTLRPISKPSSSIATGCKKE